MEVQKNAAPPISYQNKFYCEVKWENSKLSP